MRGREAWRPTREWIERANITRLMRSLGHAVVPDDGPETERRVRAFVRATQEDPESFWDACVRDLGIPWIRPYERVLDLSRGNPWAEWFVGGETNIALACVARHATGPRAGARALTAETEDGAVRTFTFSEVADRVHRVAGALRSLGIGPGDTVACTLPMVAEVVFAMLGAMQVGANGGQMAGKQ